MSRIASSMLRYGNMTESETVVLYATVTVLTRWGVPAKEAMMQLVRMVPPMRLAEFEDEVKRVVDDMVGSEEHPTAPSDATTLRTLAQQILDGGAEGPVWALCNGVKALAYEATLESTDEYSHNEGGQNEDDGRDARRRDIDEKRECDRVDPTEP